MGASVARAWSCSVSETVPEAMAGSVSSSSSAPARASRPDRVPAVSSPVMGSRRTAATGPVSSPSSMRMIETPVSASPRMTAHWMGPAPR
jgi:hypothetical protein